MLEAGAKSEGEVTATKLRNINEKKKNKNINELKERWKDKPLHGKYPIRASDPVANSPLTHQWLASSGLKSETEGFIIAVQDQSPPTRDSQAKILENGADPKCRVCDKQTESIDHLVPGCPMLAPKEYLNQHERLGQYIYWCMKAIGGNINYQKSLKTKMSPFYRISTSILTGQSRQTDQT